MHTIPPNPFGRPATIIPPFSINFSSSLLLPSIFHPRPSLRHTTTWISTPSRRRRCYRHSTIGPAIHHLPLLGFQIAKREPVGSPFKTASPSPPFSVSCVYGKVGCTLFLLKEFCNGYLLVMGLSLINQVYGVLVFTNESTLNFCA